VASDDDTLKGGLGCRHCALGLRAVRCSEPRDFPWIRPTTRNDAGAGPGRSGKWLIYPTCGRAVRVWRAIASAVRDRDLWDAKISVTQAQVLEGRHIVCVYTSDFCNAADVRDAAIKLVKLGVVNERTIYYKPDLMTLEGVYSDTGAASIFGLRAETTFLFKTPGARTLDPRLHRLIDQGLEALAVLPRPPTKRRQGRGRPRD
jgi:hypothetical protein